MSKELLQTSPLAVDRLQQIFFPNETQRRRECFATRVRLNEHQSIAAHYYPGIDRYKAEFWCRIEKDIRSIMGFNVGYYGLRNLWLAKMSLSSPGGSEPIEPIRLQEGFHILSEWEWNRIVVEEDDLDKFRELGNYLTDWVERTIKEGRFLALPLQLCSEVNP